MSKEPELKSCPFLEQLFSEDSEFRADIVAGLEYAAARVDEHPEWDDDNDLLVTIPVGAFRRARKRTGGA